MELEKLKESINIITDIEAEFELIKQKLQKQKQEALSEFKTFLTELTHTLNEICDNTESDQNYARDTHKLGSKICIQQYNGIQFLSYIDNVSITYNSETECIEILEIYDESEISFLGKSPIYYDLNIPYKLFAAPNIKDALDTLKKYFIDGYYKNSLDKNELSKELFKIMESDLSVTDEEKYLKEVQRITNEVKLINKFSKFDIHKFNVTYSDTMD